MTSAGGTGIRVWLAGTDGPDVLVCPGLATIPETWPALLAPNGGLRVIGWHQRGRSGSAAANGGRPAGLDDHVADAVATMDDARIGRCVVAGWSFGVTTAVELAIRYPERVSGLLLMAGAPGRSFEAVLDVLDVPAAVREPLARTVTRVLAGCGPLLTAVGSRLPVHSATTWALRRAGLMLPAVRDQVAVAAVRRFLDHDWGTFFATMTALGDTPRLDLRGLSCPITVLAGRYDLVSGRRSIFGGAGPLPQARLRLLPTSHLLPMEAVDELRRELTLLLRRVEAVDQAVHLAESGRKVSSRQRQGGIAMLGRLEPRA